MSWCLWVAILMIFGWAIAHAQVLRPAYPIRGQVVIAGYCEEDSTFHAIRVDRHGRVIVSREGQ